MKMYVCKINPQPWQIGPLSVGRGKGGSFFPRVGRAEEMVVYQQALAEELGNAYPELLDAEAEPFEHGEVHLELYFSRQIVEYTTSRRRSQDHICDLTNLFKSTEDALQGILYTNDRQVTSQKAGIISQQFAVVPLVIIRARRATTADIPSEVYDAWDDATQEYLSATGEPENAWPPPAAD